MIKSERSRLERIERLKYLIERAAKERTSGRETIYQELLVRSWHLELGGLLAIQRRWERTDAR